MNRWLLGLLLAVVTAAGGYVGVNIPIVNACDTLLDICLRDGSRSFAQCRVEYEECKATRLGIAE